MKKRWIAVTATACTLALAAGAIWVARPALTEALSQTVSTSINEHVNGTVSYHALNWSLDGDVILTDPVVADQEGQTVLSGQAVYISIDWLQTIRSLADGGGPVAAISAVTVERPIVDLKENEQQQWNVAGLIKTGGDNSDPGFRGAVRIHEGIVRTTLSDGTFIEAGACNGRIDFSGYPSLQGSLEAQVDGEPLSLSGHYTSARRYDAVIKANSVKALYLASFIPASVPVTVEDGTVDQVRLRISQDRDGLGFSGQAGISGGKAVVSGYAVDGLEGQIHLNEDEVTIDKAAARINGQALSAKGSIKINTGSPIFQIFVDAPDVDVAALANGMDIPFEGHGGAKLQVWGSTDDWSAAGTVSLPSVTVQGLDIEKGQADFSYGNNILGISSFSADVAGGHVEGSGAYESGGAFQAELQADGVDLGRIPQVPASVLGVVSGDVRLSGTSSDDIQADGHIKANNVSYNGFEAEQAESDFSYSQGVLRLSKGQASVGGGTLQVSGVYGGNQTDLSVTASSVPLSLFSSYASVPLNGTVSAAAHLWGSRPEWDVIFNAVDGSVQGMPFDTVQGTLHSEGSRIVVPSLAWVYKDGTHRGRGYVDLDDRTIRLSLDTDHMRLEKILPLLGKSQLPLTGWLDNHIDVSGTLDNLSAAGSIRLHDGSAYGYLYKTAQARYSFEKGSLLLSDGDIEAYSSHIHVYGSVGSQLALHIESPDVDIARLFSQNKIPHEGSLALSAYIGGTIDSPTAVGTIRSDKVTINHMPFTDLYGEVGYYGGIARLSDLHFSQNGGAYQANGTWNTQSGWISARGSVVSADMASWITLLGLPIQNISGKIDGDVEIGGTIDDPHGSIKGKVTESTIDGYAVTPSDIDLELEHGVVKVNRLSIEADGGLLRVAGTYALHGPVNLQAGCRNFSSRLLLDAAGQSSLPVDTRIDGAVMVNGTGDHPNADISVQFNGGTINGIGITNVYGLFNLRDRILHIDQAFISREPYKASAYGDIPISALTGESTDEAMKVTVKLDNAGLDALTFLTPAVTEGSGELDGTVLVTGTAAAPALQGKISVQDGRVKFRYLENPLDHINGTLTFTGHEASFNSTGMMKAKKKLGKTKPKGSYTASGTVKWTGRSLTSYEGVLEMNDLAIDCPYYRGPLSGQLALDPGQGRPDFSGIINIDNAIVNVPLGLESSGSSTDLGLNLTVALGDNVRLYNPVLYDLIVEGTANFQGTVAHPQPSGRFEAKRGSVRYLNTRFQVTKATADFSQMDSFLPYLHVEGAGRVSTYNIALNLTGPVDNMNLRLHSQPPLSRQQIISLMTLRNGGRNSSSITGEDVSNLVSTGMLMTLNSLGITSELEQFLRLDMLNITTGSLGYNEKITAENKNYYNIEMGKYLFNDFMITAAFGVNHNDNNVGFRYDLGTHFGVNAWHRSDGEYFAGGMYRYSF